MTPIPDELQAALKTVMEADRWKTDGYTWHKGRVLITMATDNDVIAACVRWLDAHWDTTDSLAWSDVARGWKDGILLGLLRAVIECMDSQ